MLSILACIGVQSKRNADAQEDAGRAMADLSAKSAQAEKLLEQIQEQQRQLVTQAAEIKRQGERELVARVELPRGFVTPRNTPPAPKPTPLPILNLRHTSKAIPSTRADAPYGLEVTIQTNVTINGIDLDIVCSGPVSSGELMPSGNFTGMVAGGVRVVPDHPNILAASMISPVFEPAIPLLVRVYSKEYVEVTEMKWQRH